MMESELVTFIREISIGAYEPAEQRKRALELLAAHDAREGGEIDAYGYRVARMQPGRGELMWTNPAPHAAPPSALSKTVRMDVPAAQRQPSVADWAMVPREPTPEMKNRGAYMVSGVTQEGAAVIWRAMLASAPQPQEK